MKYLSAFCAVCALTACQTSDLPILEKVTQLKASGQAGNAPMRPSGAAFSIVKDTQVTDFQSCVAIGIVVPGSAPVQCVYGGITYTNK